MSSYVFALQAVSISFLFFSERDWSKTTKFQTHLSTGALLVQKFFPPKCELPGDFANKAILGRAMHA